MIFLRNLNRTADISALMCVGEFPLLYGQCAAGVCRGIHRGVFCCGAHTVNIQICYDAVDRGVADEGSAAIHAVFGGVDGDALPDGGLTLRSIYADIGDDADIAQGRYATRPDTVIDIVHHSAAGHGKRSPVLNVIKAAVGDLGGTIYHQKTIYVAAGDGGGTDLIIVSAYHLTDGHSTRHFTTRTGRSDGAVILHGYLTVLGDTKRAVTGRSECIFRLKRERCAAAHRHAAALLIHSGGTVILHRGSQAHLTAGKAAGAVRQLHRLNSIVGTTARVIQRDRAAGDVQLTVRDGNQAAAAICLPADGTAFQVQRTALDRNDIEVDV